jgi:hypothetical protein
MNIICFRLRICGSQRNHDFLDAFDYYSLWPLEPNAMQFLRSANIGHTPGEWSANEQVLYGKDSETVTIVRKDTPGGNASKEEDMDLSKPVSVPMARMHLGTPLTEGVTLNQSSEEDEIIVLEESTGFEGRALEQRFAVHDV